MHMDESHKSIPPNQVDCWSALEPTTAVADPPPADWARSHERAALRRQPHSEQIDLRRNEFSGGASVAVYCGNQDEVSQGFLVALGAMGVAVFEEGAEPARPSFPRLKP
jgi:hypothetical protein